MLGVRPKTVEEMQILNSAKALATDWNLSPSKITVSKKAPETFYLTSTPIMSASYTNEKTLTTENISPISAESSSTSKQRHKRKLAFQELDDCSPSKSPTSSPAVDVSEDLELDTLDSACHLMMPMTFLGDHLKVGVISARKTSLTSRKKRMMRSSYLKRSKMKKTMRCMMLTLTTVSALSACKKFTNC
jgi:hypothetical protein